MTRPCIPDHARGHRFVEGKNAAGSGVIRRRGHGARLVLQTRAMKRLPESKREAHVAATMPSTYISARSMTMREHEKVFHMPCTLALAALPLRAPAQHVRKDTCHLPHFTPELNPELATMCIDAPWPLSTASSRISGSLSDTKASLLELCKLGPGALPLLQPMPCTICNENLPVRLQVPPPSLPANCAAPAVFQG